MSSNLDEEMQILLVRIQELKDRFQQNLEANVRFDETKKIYLEIKEANSRVEEYLGRNTIDEGMKSRE